MTREKIVSITIDNKEIDVRPSSTILQAARANGIFIPSLCALEHLPSYGACRLCVVEVDGLRGFPTSCTTPVESGMVIRTDTAELRSLRQEILKLLLSEHPASCLFCPEQDKCKDYQGTIRKVGVTTGCRYCPNDRRCELQDVAEKIGLTDTSYPIYYRGFPVEKEDPFYDRDYNLCILCGRCVRVCNSVRLSGTLSFKQRGKTTTIGPAFSRTHQEAGCEFCGACVSVCPTGALSTKVSKWYGKPDAQVATTCGYCPVGCQVLLQTKNNQVLDVLADYSSPVDHGLICVKGRFAIPEYIHSPRRLSHPQLLTPVGYDDVSWEKAAEIAAEKLSGIDHGDVLIMVSPQLSTEDLFAAHAFGTEVVGGAYVTSSVVTELGTDLAGFLDLVTTSGSFDDIDKADAILTLGFDSRYGYSPVGIKIKRAVREGKVAVSVRENGSNLDIVSEAAFSTDSRSWPELLDLLLNPAKAHKDKPAKPSDLMAVFGDDIRRIRELFNTSSNKVVIAGSEVFTAPERHDLIKKLIGARNEGAWKIVVLHPYTNLAGMLVSGMIPGIEPGKIIKQSPDGGTVRIADHLTHKDLEKHWKVVYLIGETLSTSVPDCDYFIYQNALPASFSRQPDLILPSALFPESEGTMISNEGRVLPFRKAIGPFMDSRPDWWILARIAAAMDKGKLQPADLLSVQKVIRKYMKGFPDVKKPLQFVRVDSSSTSQLGSHKTVHGPVGVPGKRSAYRGIALADVVPGMGAIESGM